MKKPDFYLFIYFPLPNSYWFYCFVFWLDALYPYCVSVKLLIICGYYPKLKQPLSLENQYKISGYLSNTSLYHLMDFCLQVGLLQLFLFKRNLDAYCCLTPVSNLKVIGNNFRNWEKKIHRSTKWNPNWYRA